MPGQSCSPRRRDGLMRCCVRRPVPVESLHAAVGGVLDCVVGVRVPSNARARSGAGSAAVPRVARPVVTPAHTAAKTPTRPRPLRCGDEHCKDSEICCQSDPEFTCVAADPRNLPARCRERGGADRRRLQARLRQVVRPGALREEQDAQLHGVARAVRELPGLSGGRRVLRAERGGRRGLRCAGARRLHPARRQPLPDPGSVRGRPARVPRSGLRVRVRKLRARRSPGGLRRPDVPERHVLL